MCTQLFDYIAAWWPSIKDFANSNFFGAIAGSFAGALAGAYGAQQIAEKAKLREQLLKEIRGTNTAIMLAFGICNSLLALKRQHLKALKENLETQKAALLDHNKKMAAGLISKDAVFHFSVDFQTLSLPPLAIDILQIQVFEKLSLEGRPIALTTILGETIHNLRSSLELRNQLIDAYRKRGEEVSAEEYFGLRQAGQVNEMYPSSIHNAYHQVDDGIFFCHLLCQDMIEHGNGIVEQFKKNFKKGAPTISRADFSQAEGLGLMPKTDDYTGWLSAFVKAQDATSK